jgi:hypothetical protein
MMDIMLFGIIMAAFAGVFWIVEALPFAIALIKIDKDNKSDNWMTNAKQTVIYNARIASALPLLAPLAIDLLITSSLTGIFSFGGTTGGIIGLFISNIMSVFLLVVNLFTLKGRA